MTRDEAIQSIQAIERRCRGVFVAAEAQERVVQLLRAGELEAARRLDAAARRPCGADLNRVILAGPLDGQEHEGVCPSCGLRFRYRPPLVDEAPPPPEEPVPAAPEPRRSTWWRRLIEAL
jgi:hypothetical protein